MIKELLFAALIAPQVGVSCEEVENAYSVFVQDFKAEQKG